jgi:DNA-directed RNA polymerase specialized sigma24 family protein
MRGVVLAGYAVGRLWLDRSHIGAESELIVEVRGGDDTLSALLDGLAVEQRDAVRARVIDDRSYDEIAVALRCSPAAARKRVSRGLARLRNQVGEESS